MTACRSLRSARNNPALCRLSSWPRRATASSRSAHGPLRHRHLRWIVSQAQQRGARHRPRSLSHGYRVKRISVSATVTRGLISRFRHEPRGADAGIGRCTSNRGRTIPACAGSQDPAEVVDNLRPTASTFCLSSAATAPSRCDAHHRGDRAPGPEDRRRRYPQDDRQRHPLHRSQLRLDSAYAPRGRDPQRRVESHGGALRHSG